MKHASTPLRFPFAAASRTYQNLLLSYIFNNKSYLFIFIFNSFTFFFVLYFPSNFLRIKYSIKYEENKNYLPNEDLYLFFFLYLFI